MTALFADRMFLPHGWAHRVRLQLDDAGIIERIDTNAEPGDARHLPGPTVPGMVNVHSHAFQRLIAGFTDIAEDPDDSFWSWREAMYRAALALDADDFETVCRHVYVEMLRAGYTTVGEFHYVHHQPDGTPHDHSAELALRAVAAAADTGIGMALLPVLYGHSGFGGQDPTTGQRRFINDVDDYLSLHAAAAEAAHDHATITTGVAFHSLRAVTGEEMTEVLNALPDHLPVHIHVAEQQREVEDCVAWSGRRPVAWLLDHMPVDERWCLIHATHLHDVEIDALARHRPVIGLCPVTEANLGDGIARAIDLNHRGLGLAIGSDSHVSVDPVEELRWLEYGQRLISGRRNRMTGPHSTAVGEHLYHTAAEAGARAIGQPVGRIEVGGRADLVVLDDRDVQLADCPDRHRLNRWLFATDERAIRQVRVAGRTVVDDGHHHDQERAAAAFHDVCRRLLYT